MEQKHVKYAGYAVLALIAILVIMYAVKFFKSKIAAVSTKTIVPIASLKTLPVNTNAICTRGNSFPLQQGSCGANVTALQRTLNKYGNVAIDVDGKFGPMTKSALAAATGKISITQAQLNAYVSKYTAKNVDYFDDTNTGSWDTTSGVTNPASQAPSTAYYPQDLNAFAIDIQTDLDGVYLLSTRGNGGVWATMLLLTPQDLGKVAAYIKKTYGKSLYDQIANARWSVTSDADIKLKNKLTAAGWGQGK